jgi:hypothetical protein
VGCLVGQEHEGEDEAEAVDHGRVGA